MTNYYKARYYTFSHIVIGFTAVWYPIVGILALVYQLGQLIFNVRVFPVEWKIEEGNSIQHTAKKILEIGAGFIFGYLMKKIAL